jgi:hypothetical protein
VSASACVIFLLTSLLEIARKKSAGLQLVQAGASVVSTWLDGHLSAA